LIVGRACADGHCLHERALVVILKDVIQNGPVEQVRRCCGRRWSETAQQPVAQRVDCRGRVRRGDLCLDVGQVFRLCVQEFQFHVARLRGRHEVEIRDAYERIAVAAGSDKRRDERNQRIRHRADVHAVGRAAPQRRELRGRIVRLADDVTVDFDG